MAPDTKEIKTLKEELSELKIAVKDTNRNVDRLVFLLNNDEGTGRIGLFGEVKVIDKDVKDLKKKMDDYIKSQEIANAFAKGKIAAYGLVGGVLWSIVTLILNYLLKKA